MSRRFCDRDTFYNVMCDVLLWNDREDGADGPELQAHPRFPEQDYLLLDVCAGVYPWRSGRILQKMQKSVEKRVDTPQVV